KPYIAIEEGSLNTSSDSISCGEIKSILSCRTPSTTYNGFELLVLLTPRIRTVGEPPGVPELDMVKPATLPCKELIGFAFGILAMASPFTLAIDPVKSTFLCVPYPTTTPSS